MKLSLVNFLFLLSSIALLVMAMLATQVYVVFALLNGSLAIGWLATLDVRGKLRKDSPVFWTTAGFLILYCAHPLAMHQAGKIYRPYQGFLSLSEFYGQAVGTATLAFATFAVAYEVTRENPKVSIVSSTTVEWHADKIRSAGRITAVVAISAYAVYAVQNGTSFMSALAGGASRLSVDSSAYLYLAPQALGPAMLMLLFADRVQGRAPIGVTALAIVQLLIFVPTGQRLVLLTSLAPAVLYWFALRNRKLALRILVPTLLLGLFVGIGLRDAGTGQASRTLTESLGRTATEPLDSLLDFATGADTEMVDALSIELKYFAAGVSYDPGRTVLAALAAPVPSSLWASKIRTADGELNNRIFGTEYNNAGVAYGFIGELYFDYGSVAVALGFAFFGVALRRLERFSGRGPLWLAVYVSCAPLAVALLRGSLGLILGRALFTVGPLLLLIFIISRRIVRSPAADIRSAHETGDADVTVPLVPASRRVSRDSG